MASAQLRTEMTNLLQEIYEQLARHAVFSKVSYSDAGDLFQRILNFEDKLG